MRCWGVKQDTMSTWAWIAVGLASFLLVSVLVGLAVAAILRRIGERVSEPYEAGDWAEAALTRALHQQRNRQKPRGRTLIRAGSFACGKSLRPAKQLS